MLSAVILLPAAVLALRQRRPLIVKEEQDDISEHGQRCHDGGVSAASFIFEQAYVLSSVVSWSTKGQNN